MCVLARKSVIEGMVDEVLQSWLVLAIKFKQVLSNKIVLLSTLVEFIVKNIPEVGDRGIIVVAVEQNSLKPLPKSLFRVNTS